MSTGPLLRLLALAAVTGCGVTSSAPTAHIVGTQTLAIVDPVRHRSLTSEIWFSAKPGSRTESFAPLLPIRPITIARGAEPQAGGAKRPLILLSHGNWGTRYSQGWLARQLVEHGYLVVSLSHPGTMRDDQSDEGLFRIWERTQDVTVVLDQLLTHPIWSQMIDATKIGFVGHSFGGWTGVALAGGLYDPDKQLDVCRSTEPDFYCRGLLALNAASIDRRGAKISARDERIKAYYIMGAGPAQGFSRDSLASIRARFLVDSALADEILGYAANSKVFADDIPGATEIKRAVGHFVYVPECKPVLGGLFAGRICHDPDGVDRAKAHGEIATSVLAFFQNALP